jgi:hypothetical protein
MARCRGLGDGTGAICYLIGVMRCFYHSEREAVGLCKYCAKAVCVECAVDLSQGLACRDRCEEKVRALIKLIDRNIESAGGTPSARLVSLTPAGQPSGQSTDYVAQQFSAHVRTARRFWWLSACVYLAVGLAMLAFGVARSAATFQLVGGCLVVFGIVAAFYASRSARKPSMPETTTTTR